MPQHDDPKTLERSQALRQRASTLYMKALERVEVANRIRQRAAQLLPAAAATQQKTLQSRGPNSNIVKSLKIDLDVALNFVKIALQSRSDHDKRTRNQANARKAHDSVVRWKNRVKISESDALEIDAKFQELRSALEKLGERL